MQIGWIESDFRNLTAKVWANLDNPVRELWFFKVLINFLYAALSGGTLLYSLPCHRRARMEHSTCTSHNFTSRHENISSLYSIVWLVRAIMIVRAFLIEIDQPDYIGIKTTKNANCENLWTKSMESCSLVASQILAEFRPERATYKTLHN